MTDEELIKQYLEKNIVSPCPTRYCASVLGAADLSHIKTAEPKRRKKAWNMCSKPEKLDIASHNEARQEAREIMAAKSMRNNNKETKKVQTKTKNKPTRKQKSRQQYLDIVINRDADIKKDYIAGMPQAEICKKYGVSVRTVQRATAGSGIVRKIPRKVGPRAATPLDHSIAAMVKDGWTIHQAAQAHGIGYDQARYGLHIVGCKTSGRGKHGTHVGETPPDMTGKFLADNT